MLFNQTEAEANLHFSPYLNWSSFVKVKKEKEELSPQVFNN